MKYKILLNGRNSMLVTDFIQYTDSYFKCLSTSGCIKDILNHFELFQPDAYVCFVDSSYNDFLAQIKALKGDNVYNSAPIIVIADDETGREIDEKSLNFYNLLIKRPISPDNLALKITRYLEKLKEIEEAAKNLRHEEAPEAAPVPEETKKHLLIVDDDRSVLKLLKSALSDEYDVTTMANGTLVEKFLETKKVDLVILDYEMPVETGAEVFRKIKANEKIKNVPVCFLTGVSERSKIMEIMTLKPHGYLLKPIDMDMLRATISNITNEYV